MRKLPWDEVGIARQNQVFMFSISPDPYVVIVLDVDAQPLIDVVAARRESSGKPVTMIHALNKMLGIAFAENPEYNCVVLDRRIYQLENVTISNPYLLPGDQRALTMLLMEDPQNKSLEEIADFFESEKQVKREEFEVTGQTRIGLAPKFLLRSGLYKIISEKMQFKTLYTRSLTTNLVISKANHPITGNFLATRGAMQVLRTFMRFFPHAVVYKSRMVDGECVPKPVLPITMMLDHRLVDGAHVNAFVKSINAITDDADNRL